MRKTLLIIDTSYLAYRSFYAMGELQYDGVGTVVPFGVLRDTVILHERFVPDRTAFCFDIGMPKRKLYCQSYKERRRKEEQDDEEKSKARGEVRRQIKRLYRSILPSLGYNNLFGHKGYEADDLIARLALRYPKIDKVIVGADSDLYQLISERASVYNPQKKKLITKKSFEEEWGICPSMWGLVKAIAGCTTDNIPGVKGVGEKTAVKFVSGRLQSGKIFEKIVNQRAFWQENLKLVQLPFEGTPDCKVVPDTVSQKRWKEVKKELGINSF